MQELHINSKEAAEHSRCGANIYQVQADPNCATFLPAIVGVGKMRPYNRHQYLSLVVHTKLMRLGLSIPAAGKLVTRITEELFLHPDAGAVVIECHENGYNAFYAVERDDLPFERSDASRAAGPSALRVSLDIAGMWDGVNHVFATYGRRIGGEDAE